MATADASTAQTDVALYLVHDLIPGEQGERCIDEVRLLGRPEHLLSAHHGCAVECNLPFYGRSLHSVDIIGQYCSMQAELHAKAHVCLLLALEFYAEAENAPIKIRSPTYVRDVCGTNCLQPDW